MTEPNSKSEKPKEERRYDPKLLTKGLQYDLDQYEMLKRCADKRDMTEWNEWRKKHPNKEIFLEGAKFQRLFMDDVRLDEDTPNRLGKVCLKDAVLTGAHLNKARFMKADLRGCNFRHTKLNGANLILADIRDADFSYAQLQKAKFPFVIVNEKTRFFKGSIDRDTWFWGVALHSMRIADEMRLLLEYTVRRKKWESWFRYRDWYEAYPEKERSKVDRIIRQPINWFWRISDYGLRTLRIIVTFFVLTFIFAIAYWLWPNCLIANGEIGDTRGLWHALYFSIVTTTTLGFGDIAANPESWLGQTLLMTQVILGYVLLGALVTRFAVLFTAGGPAGKFAVKTWDRPCPKPKTSWDELAVDKTILQAGDVIHVQNRGILSNLIRFFSRAWKEEPSWASHTAMVLRVGEEVEIIEALWKTVVRPITAYKGKKSMLLVSRKPGAIDQEQRQKMIEKAEYYNGKTYGFWKIAFHVLDRLLNNRYVFRRLIKDNEYPICSWLVAYVYDRILGYQFGTEPNAAQPDDILDHCLDYDWDFIWADSSESVENFCRTYKLSDKNAFI